MHYNSEFKLSYSLSERHRGFYTNAHADVSNAGRGLMSGLGPVWSYVAISTEISCIRTNVNRLCDFLQSLT